MSRDAGAAAEQPLGSKMNCARSLPLSVGWDSILPKRAVGNHFCELGLGDPNLYGEEEMRKRIETKYRENFVLKGGGCSRLSGSKTSACEKSFHVTHMDSDGHSRTCCDRSDKLRAWMLLCLDRLKVFLMLFSRPPAPTNLPHLNLSVATRLKGISRSFPGLLTAADCSLTRTQGRATPKKRKPSVSGGGSSSKARRTANGGRATGEWEDRDAQELPLAATRLPRTVQPPPMGHLWPVLNVWEYLIRVPGRGDCECTDPSPPVLFPPRQSVRAGNFLKTVPGHGLHF